MDEQDKIDAIMEYAEKHPSFDTEFVESLQDWISSNGELTDSQNSALDNIIDNFRIKW